MSKKELPLRIKLVQLPIPEVLPLYSEGNIPIAAGYLKAYGLAGGWVEKNTIEILDRGLSNFGGDAAILAELLSGAPSIIGFTSYMWNIDRNLYLARKIKEAKPDTTIIMGGPEIDDRHRAMEEIAVDAVVPGEGENAFMDFLHDYTQGGPIKKIYRGAEPIALADIPNPYLEGIITPQPGESMFIETMRGCPYPCKYCFYSKTYKGLRYFPENQLPQLFEFAHSNNLPEIYLMDPSFNVSPDLVNKLELIKSLNPGRIPIHTEIRLESVTPEIARLMSEAGFRSVEAGLQSVNPRSLKAIGRDWNREKFIRGAGLLQDRDIDVKTGVILGLPYDSLSDFENTIDFVMDLNLEEAMEIYPLSVIPGTKLRDESTSMELDVMPHPPYWVVGNSKMGERDFKSAIDMIENKLGIEFFPPVIPRFKNSVPGFMDFLDLRAGTRIPEQKERWNVNLLKPELPVAGSLTILLDESTDMDEVADFGKMVSAENPFTLVQLVLDWQSVPSRMIIERLAQAFDTPKQYFDHIHHFKIDSQEKHSLRFFHLTGNPVTADRYLWQPCYCDLVLRYTEGLINKGKEILEEIPILLVDSPIPKTELEELKVIYEDFESFLILPSSD
ncbi:MAG: radical SAM protein [bacterium]|nr:radical SAM protein [bacterium]